MTTSTCSPTPSSRPAAPTPTRWSTAMEKTDYVGTIGRIEFLPQGRRSPMACGSAPGYITGLMVQWQDGKQVTVWPKDVANGKMTFPRSSSCRKTEPHGSVARGRGRRRRMLALQILIDGFAISSLYALGRRRLHADLRRLRRAQPVARRDHGGGRGGRLGGARRSRLRRLSRRAGGRRRRPRCCASRPIS